MQPIIIKPQPFLIMHVLPLIILSTAAWFVSDHSPLSSYIYGDSARETIAIFAGGAILSYMFGYVVYLIPSSILGAREFEELRKK